MRLLRVSKAYERLHGIKVGSLDDVGPFPPILEHVFSQRCHTRGRNPSSLKASFESE
jgi:hypothetical protein